MVIRYDGIGDTVNLAPLLAALRDAGHTLGLVVSPPAVGLFRSDVVRSHVVEDLEQPHSVLPDLLAREYDIALIATEKAYGYTLAERAGIRRRIGFWNGFGKPLKSWWVRKICTDVRWRGLSIGGEHEATMLFRLGRQLHPEAQPTRDLERLRHLFFRVAPARQRVLAVQVTQKWLSFGDIDTLARMLRELFQRVPSMRCLGAASEERFLVALEKRCEVAIERHHTAQTWVERLGSAAILLTPDTGAAHVAGMIGTKVIDCFPADTPTRLQNRWRPWASPSILYTMDILHKIGITAAVQSACERLDEPFTLFS